MTHPYPSFPAYPPGDMGETVEEILTVHGKPIKLYQQEGAFSQPNAKVCEKRQNNHEHYCCKTYLYSLCLYSTSTPPN